MKQEHEQMIDERIQFLQKWLTSLTHHQSRENQQFVNKFLHLVSTDHKTKQIFVKNLKGLLQSRQINLDKIFQYCLNEKTTIYEKEICTFLQECINEKNEIFMAEGLENYIMHNIWRDNMEKFINKAMITPLQIIEFLSLKMRSLNTKTRKQAVDSLQKIIEHILQGNKSAFCTQIQKILPQMIEKQNYGKEVCFYRGVLLQILQDQFCHIKKKGIQLLGKAQCFFQTSMIRPLILYMLNDEHEAVRQTCLIVLSKIPSFDLEKEDLNALLVCLKENNTSMRNYTYESLCHINITSPADFKVIFDRLFVTLLNRSEDKRKIYIVCSKLGKKYPNYVLANLESIYKYNDNEEPNWKNLVYRARLIVVAAMGKEKWPKTLPKYFVSHYLYIRDVLIYAFDQKKQQNEPMTDVSSPNTMQQQNQWNKVSIYLDTDWQLYQYVQAIGHSSQGFLKSLFGIILDWFRLTKMAKFITAQIIKQLLLQLQKLYIMFDVYIEEKAQSFIQYVGNAIKQSDLAQIRSIILKLRSQQTWNKLQKIESILFKITNSDKTIIVISNRPEILKRSFVQFSNFLPRNPNQQMQSSQVVGYLRMSQVDFEEVDEKLCRYKVNFKCKRLRCLILYGNPPQQYIAHTSSEEDADFK